MLSITLKKTVIVVTSILIGFFIVFLMKGYLSDSRFTFSFMVKPTVSGQYEYYVLYTDEENKDINTKIDDELLPLKPIYLPSDRYTEIKYTIYNRPYYNLNKFCLVIKYIENAKDQLSVSIEQPKVNQILIGKLYEVEHILGNSKVEKCSIKKCKNSMSSRFDVSFRKDKAHFYVNSDLEISSSIAHIANFGTVIVLILSSSFFYCIICFLLNKKREQNAKISDLVFVTFVFITALIPILYFDARQNLEISNENRIASNYETLFTNIWNHPINLKWSKQFETYFNDRFGMRNELVSLQKKIAIQFQNVIYSKNFSFCQKKNSWCFLEKEELGDFKQKNSSYVNVEYIKKIASSTIKPVYVLVYPVKTEIYPEKVLIFKHTPTPILPFSDYATATISKINIPNLHVINLKTIFMKEKSMHPDNLLYFTDEHHATEYANKVVMEYLNGKIPEFKFHNLSFKIDKKYPGENLQLATGEFIEDKQSVGILYGQIWGTVFGQNNRNERVLYTVPQKYPFFSLSDKYSNDITYHKGKCWGNGLLHNKNHSQFKIAVLGHSFVETFSKLAATSASDVYRIRYNDKCREISNFDQLKRKLKIINPDVIIIAFWYETFNTAN